MADTEVLAAKKLKVARDGDVAILTLSDPTTLNAMSLDMAEQLREALIDITEGANPARAAILTGEGRGFCSGANLVAVGARPKDQPGGTVDALKTIYNPLTLRIRDLPIPLITAINGPAAGVGCSYALLGDMIVAGESAYFLQAFRRIGLVPDGGSSYLLSRSIGRARAMEMALLGEKLPAAKALEWGLINRCVPDAELMPTALELAHNLAHGAKSLGMIRRLLWQGLDAALEDALENERLMQQQAHHTEDHHEGVQAFLQKRPAVFKGR